jgi:hypothetical protein
VLDKITFRINMSEEIKKDSADGIQALEGAWSTLRMSIDMRWPGD